MFNKLTSCLDLICPLLPSKLLFPSGQWFKQSHIQSRYRPVGYDPALTLLRHFPRNKKCHKMPYCLHFSLGWKVGQQSFLEQGCAEWYGNSVGMGQLRRATSVPPRPDVYKMWPKFSNLQQIFIAFNGHVLFWCFQQNVSWKSSSVTYLSGGLTCRTKSDARTFSSDTRSWIMGEH